MHNWLCNIVTALVTLTKLSYVEPLVLGLVTFSGSTIPVVIHVTQAHSAWPLLLGMYNEYWQ